MKVCKRTHHSEAFGGEVPAGSLWENDHDVVAETPSAFGNVRAARGSTLEVDDDEDEVA